MDAQSCECTNCPGTIPVSTTTTFEFLSADATNNNLGNVDQGVCGIVVEFIPDHIWSLEMTLTSPSGQQVTLIGPPVNQFGLTGPFAWEITFLPCGDVVAPDPGFNPVWDNDQPWVLGGIYDGSYYPYSGCLEDFDNGPVDGVWTLDINNTSPFNTAQLLDFRVLFCDDDGLGCFVCEADAGGFMDTTAITACQGDTNLLRLDLDPVLMSQTDTSVYGYTYLVSGADTLLAIDSLLDLSDFPGGTYKISGLQYRWADSLNLPSATGLTTISEIEAELNSLNPDFCGDLTDTCLTVNIISVDTTFRTEYICQGDSLVFDTFSFDTSGTYMLSYEAASSCDSIIIIDLTVLPLRDTIVNDTICVEDTYFFGGQFLNTSGSYFDTLQAENGCDSTIILNLIVRDSITNQIEAVICSGEVYSFGNLNYSTSGEYTAVFLAENGCDSIVTLDLTVLDPVIDIETPDVLDCANETVFLDATGSTGEALTFQWLDLFNGGAGILNGEETPTPEIALPGTYLLIITDTLGGNSCSVTTNVGVAADQNPPNISAIGGTVACDEPTTTLTGISLSPGSTFLWEGPDNFSSAEQNPTVNLPGVYTLYVTGGNNCIDSISVMVAADTIRPQVTASVSDTLDCDDFFVQLNAVASADVANYSWSGPNSFTSSAINPFANTPGWYYINVTADNGCTNIDSVEIIQDEDVPDVLIIGDTLDCINLQGQVIASTSVVDAIFSWTGPNSFNANIPNPVVTEPGDYTVEVTGPNGCSSFATVEVLQDGTLPDVVAIGDTLDCNNPTGQLQASSLTADVIYSWVGPNSFSSDLPNPDVTEPGDYTVEVTGPNGCSSFATVEVLQNGTLPDVIVVSDTLDCNNPTGQLEASSLTVDVTYSWVGPNSFSSDLPNPTITESGAYTVEVTGPNGCSSFATVEVEQDSILPDVMAIGDTLDCSHPTGQLEASSLTVDVTYSWVGPNSFNSNLSNPTVTEQGDYTIEVTGSNGCSSFATVEVLQDNALPDVMVVGDTLDCNNSTGQLQASSLTTDVIYSWIGPNSFNSNVSNPTVTESGAYTVEVTGPNGCSSFATIEVLQDGALPNVMAIGDTLNCSNPTGQLAASSLTADVTYSWVGPNSFSSDLPNPAVTESGDYTVEVTGPNGCSSFVTVEVLQDGTLPDVTVIGDTLDCNNPTGQLEASSLTADITYSWVGPNSFSSDLPNPDVTESGDYTVEVTGPNGCSSFASVEVLLDNTLPDVMVISDTLDCSNPTGQLEASSMTADVTYSWAGPNSFSSDLPNPAVTESGDYTVEVIGPNGCSSFATVEVLQDGALPDVTAIGDTLDCTNPTGQLEASSLTADVTYNWSGPNSFSSDLPNPTVTESGNYTVEVIGPNGCSSFATIEVLQDDALPNVMVIGDTLDCNNSMGQLQASSLTSDVIYSWVGPNSFSSDLPNPLVTESGAYTVEITGPNGCSSFATVEVLQDGILPDLMVISDTLDCNNPVGQLEAISLTTDVTYSWSGPNSFSSDLSNPLVTESGDYTVEVTGPNGCSSFAMIEVLQDGALPDVTVVGDTLDCSNPNVQLEASSLTADVIYSWSGPNSFSSDLPNPTVTESGNYTVEVTGPNGCSSFASIEVLQDGALPGVTAVGDTLDCSNSMGQLEASSLTADVIYSWSGPNSFSSDLPNPTVTESGNYTVEVTGPNGCSSFATVEVLQDGALPGVTAVGDTLDCSNSMGQLEASSLTVDVIYSWSGPNSFSSNLPNPTVTESGNYTVEVTGPNGCSSFATVEVLQDGALPDVTVLSDTLDCSNPTGQLEASSLTADVTYSWVGPNSFSSDLPNPTVTESGNYTVEVTGPNGCSSFATVEVLQDGALPDVTVLSDTLDCSNPTGQLEASSLTADVTYNWVGPNSFSSDLPNPTITESGDYTVEVTGPNGCSSFATVEVEQDSILPDVMAIGDTLDCSHPTGQLEASSLTVDVTYSWGGPNSFSSDLPNPLITESGDYTVEVIGPNGCSNFATVEVLQDGALPGVVAIGDTLDCINTTGQLQASSLTVDVTYSWVGPNSFSSDLPNPTITESGDYTVEVIGPNGCSSFATVEVVQNGDLPDLSAIGDTLDCINTTAQLLASSSQANVNFSWSGPNGFAENIPNPITTEPGVYTVEAIAPNGCSSFVTVEVLQLPTDLVAQANALDAIRCNQMNVTLSALGSSSGDVTYNWYDSDTNFLGSGLEWEVDQAASFILEVAQNGSDCFALDTVEVPIDTLSPIAVIVNQSNQEELDCNISSLILDGLSSTSNEPMDFQWSFDNNVLSNETMLEVEISGTYLLEVTNQLNGCTDTATFVVMQDTVSPIVIIQEPPVINCMVTTVNIDATASSNGPFFNYIWDGPELITGIDNNNPTVSTSGIYTLVVTDVSNGCSAMATTEVIADTISPEVNIVVDGELDCEQPTVGLEADVINPDYTYIWGGPGIVSNPTAPDILVGQTGQYQVTITDESNFCSDIALAEVFGYDNFPNSVISAAQSPNCIEDGWLRIDSVLGGIAPYSLTLNGQLSNGTTFNGLEGGSYELVVVDDQGCQWDTTIILVGATELSVDLGADQIINLGDSIELDPLLNVGTGQVSGFDWTTNMTALCDTCFVQWVHPTQNSTFVITVVDSNGCVVRDELLVRVLKPRAVYIPNAFSPNGDGNNDEFFIQTDRSVAQIRQLQIFDRWGELVYANQLFPPNDPTYNWDGNMRGEALPPAVYVYHLEVEFLDGRIERFSGDLTLLR